MPRATPANYITAPDWDNSPRKIEARKSVIIDPFKSKFGERLSPNKQYWTLCGANYKDVDGSMEKMEGELGQVVQSGIVAPNQFIGVDREAVIIRNNKCIFPNIQWIEGDFADAMMDAVESKKFAPGIVNYDGVQGVKFGVPYFVRILQVLDSYVGDPVLLAANFVLRSPYMPRGRLSDHSDPGYDVIEQMQKLYAFPDHWSVQNSYFRYQGGASTRATTIMGYFTFFKEKHNTEEYYSTPGRVIVKGDDHV